jgi:hypothetical protein
VLGAPGLSIWKREQVRGRLQPNIADFCETHYWWLVHLCGFGKGGPASLPNMANPRLAPKERVFASLDINEGREPGPPGLIVPTFITNVKVGQPPIGLCFTFENRRLFLVPRFDLNCSTDFVKAFASQGL